MKKLISLLLLLSASLAGYSQMNTFGGIGLRVNDSTTYRTNAAAYHTAGYADIYFNNQATNDHYDIWNGSSYDHVFTFGGSGRSLNTFPVNIQTGNYSLTNADTIKIIKMRSASAQTLTIPTGLKVGALFTIQMDSTGVTTLSFSSSPFVSNPSGNLTLSNKQVVQLYQYQTKKWSVFKTDAATGGTVTSVAMTVPTFLSVSGSPVTSNGTLAVTLSGTALPAANGGTGITSLGTGVATALGVNTGSSGAFVVNGGALGTPSSGTLTNATGLPAASVIYTPSGTISATDAGAAIAEAASESLHLTGAETATGTKTFSNSIITGSPTNGIQVNAGPTITFYSSPGSTNIGFSTSNNFMYSVLGWQLPRITFTTSANTTDTNAPFITGGSGQTTHQSKFFNNTDGNGISLITQSSSAYGNLFTYNNVLISNSLAPVTTSTGAITHRMLAITPTINTSGGSTTVTDLYINPVETSMTGVTHYGVVESSTTALNGFGTLTPTSSLQVVGSLSTGYVAKTALYTLTVNDHTVEVTSGTHTQTLPTAVGITGREYYITNTGSGVVTIGTTSSQTFVNVIGTPTTLTLAQFDTAHVKSNGANWLKL